MGMSDLFVDKYGSSRIRTCGDYPRSNFLQRHGRTGRVGRDRGDGVYPATVGQGDGNRHGAVRRYPADERGEYRLIFVRRGWDGRGVDRTAGFPNLVWKKIELEKMCLSNTSDAEFVLLLCDVK
uniref:Uncharacterized protein n=1 Tax=Proboscia inermis TaxID=420281 RepID=A0A6T8KAX0_9STRA